jgi:predicted deacylase
LIKCYNLYQKKNYKYLGIYLFTSVLFLLALKQLYNYCENIAIYEYSTGLPGPTILIVSGSHGNESGPSAGLDDFVKELNTTFKNKTLMKSGKLIIIPTLNKCGRKLNIRWKPQDILSFNLTNSDINRNYGKKADEEGHCSITKKVQHIVDNEATYILDFHEG